MKTPKQPSGRSPYERVSVLKLSGSSRPVLGLSRPERDERRARAVLRWGHPKNPAQPKPPATIDTPLPPRLQTLLSYSVDQTLRQQLNSGLGPMPASRKQSMEIIQATVDIDASGCICIKIISINEDE
ncbi:hypothetical protein [Dyella nitratireducens]|nr:hypothetical protein [Dyella nitratireducens]